jgi:hypothetical protein
MALLYERVVTFPDDSPRPVLDDDAADGTAAFVVTFPRETDGDPHEVGIGMKSASVSFSKKASSTSAGRLLVGMWAMALRASPVIGVSRVINVGTVFLH